MSRKLLTLVVVGLFAACGFPDVQYDTGDGGGTGDGPSGTEGGSGDATIEGGAGEAGSDGPGSDGTTGDDGSGGDDSTASDAPLEAYVFEAAADAPACDHDEDNDRAPGAACGGTDCDDDDPRAYTGEPDYLTYTPTPVTHGDWNCNGTVEMQYTVNVTCGALKLGSTCDNTSGFSGNIGCGAPGSFVQCATNQILGLCGIASTTTKTQGCK